MKRRLFLTGIVVCAGCAAQDAARPGYRISAQQLREVLDRRFPQRHPVGQLLGITILTPQLGFLPESNRLSLHTDVEAAGPALRRAEKGSFDIDFALRYEPSDQSIRASRIHVQSLSLPGLAPRAAEMLDAYARVLASQAMLEVVLHRLRPRDLELAEAMGLQPGEITVVADGLVIGFVQKPR